MWCHRSRQCDVVTMWCCDIVMDIILLIKNWFYTHPHSNQPRSLNKISFYRFYAIYFNISNSFNECSRFTTNNALKWKWKIIYQTLNARARSNPLTLLNFLSRPHTQTQLFKQVYLAPASDQIKSEQVSTFSLVEETRKINLEKIA